MDACLLKTVALRGLEEDLIYGDKTTEALFPQPFLAVGRILAKEDMVVAGLDISGIVFHLLDPGARFETAFPSGKTVKKGEVIQTLYADGRALLKGERTALNFLQRLSGIATLTQRFVERVRGTSARIVDTRKTTPGLRALEKEAVRLGGGGNHRFHLSDLILIKDNHLALSGGMALAIQRARLQCSHPLKIEVEASNLKEVEEAMGCGVDMIMLDNMSIQDIQCAVALIRSNTPKILIEVSGGIHMENVAEVARCGVDLISVGALTHSAPAVDISFKITP